MISVIMYGRNDSHGYNLHKRAAISLNCISEILTDPEDEIIFVDYNTPNDMPTFPEAIADTLTHKTKSLLRILRIRPEVAAKNAKPSPLVVNEPLSRNVALRRSNPANRWILSTNPDMIFITRPPWSSLSEIARDLPSGYYGTCRIEIPEILWDDMDRLEPSANMTMLSQWGQDLHLNEVVFSHSENIFDGPGDFQLMSREQLISIAGFDERMVLGWHVDSNICKRMHILFGRTHSLLDQVFGYHCCHTRMASFSHTTSVRTENDWKSFVALVDEPRVLGQDQWGLGVTELEEVALPSNGKPSLWQILGDVLPGMSSPYFERSFTGASYDILDYDSEHVLPYLANYFTTVPSTWNIAYYGANMRLLRLLADFLEKWGFSGRVLVQADLLASGGNFDRTLPASCIMATQEQCSRDGDILVFDSGTHRIRNDLTGDPIANGRPNEPMEAWMAKLRKSFLSCALNEHSRIKEHPPRKFILVGAVHSWFECLTALCVDHILTPYSSHIRHGFIKPNLDAKSIWAQQKFHTWTGWKYAEVRRFAIEHMPGDVSGLVPACHGYREVSQKQTYYYYNDISEWNNDIRFAILFKGDFRTLRPWLAERIKREMRPVYANEGFVCFSKAPELEPLPESHPHFNVDIDRRKAVGFAVPHLSAGSLMLVAGDPGLVWLLSGRHGLVQDVSLWDERIKWAILANEDFDRMQPWLLERIKRTMRPVYATRVFVCLSGDPDVESGRWIPKGLAWWWLSGRDVWWKFKNHVLSILSRHPESWWAGPARFVVTSLRRMLRKSSACGPR